MFFGPLNSLNLMALNISNKSSQTIKIRRSLCSPRIESLIFGSLTTGRIESWAQVRTVRTFQASSVVGCRSISNKWNQMSPSILLLCQFWLMAFPHRNPNSPTGTPSKTTNSTHPPPSKRDKKSRRGKQLGSWCSSCIPEIFRISHPINQPSGGHFTPWITTITTTTTTTTIITITITIKSPSYSFSSSSSSSSSSQILAYPIVNLYQGWFEKQKNIRYISGC